MLSQVKTVFAQTLRDEIVSITLPFELKLKKTGRVRLAGLLYDEHSVALKNLVNVGDKVTLRLTSDKPDRYGRKPAHLYSKEKGWLQGLLVREHGAIPYPYEGEEAFIRDLYLLEKPQAQSALDEEITTNQFGIIQGLVIDVTHVKGTTYLNFGPNWRTDFTVKITKSNHYIFKSYGFDLPSLKGKEMRIRGWVSERNGPMIEANHPSQIEVIDR